MNYFAFLLDTAAGDGATATPGAGGDIIMWIVMIVLLVGMFIFTSRSNKKKEKEAADMRDNLQVGDEVTTIGGIIGKVVSIKDETFVLETTREKTQIRFLKGAIRSVDVKIADVTASVLETREKSAEAGSAEADAESKTEEKVDKKKK